jgi:hypothetical protein
MEARVVIERSGFTVPSGHKHVLQKRLKIAGAWWLERNAERMLQLRTVRANGDWGRYWAEIAQN